jgi:hypothetical protein
MITFKEEFIPRYIEKFSHKLTQELKQKLPDKDYFANMVEQADRITQELVKAELE